MYGTSAHLQLHFVKGHIMKEERNVIPRIKSWSKIAPGVYCSETRNLSWANYGTVVDLSKIHKTSFISSAAYLSGKVKLEGVVRIHRGAKISGRTESVIANSNVGENTIIHCSTLNNTQVYTNSLITFSSLVTCTVQDFVSLHETNLKYLSVDFATTVEDLTIASGTLPPFTTQVKFLGYHDDYDRYLCNVAGVACIVAGCRIIPIARALQYWSNKPDRKLAAACVKFAKDIVRLDPDWKKIKTDFIQVLPSVQNTVGTKAYEVDDCFLYLLAYQKVLQALSEKEREELGTVLLNEEQLKSIYSYQDTKLITVSFNRALANNIITGGPLYDQLLARSKQKAHNLSS